MRGFLFEHTSSDLNSPNGFVRTRIAAIANNRTEAFGLAAKVLPAVGLRLIDEGPEAFRAAEAAGVNPGEAKILG